VSLEGTGAAAEDGGGETVMVGVGNDCCWPLAVGASVSAPSLTPLIHLSQPASLAIQRETRQVHAFTLYTTKYTQLLLSLSAIPASPLRNYVKYSNSTPTWTRPHSTTASPAPPRRSAGPRYS
jgi:hypothetical protein